MAPKRAKKELPEDSFFNFDEPEAAARGYSIPLVSFDQDKFTVNNDAVQLLQTLSSPLAVVVVAGMYRTGKSFLLNRVILGKQRAFTVGPTTRACTKGIWMWSQPLTVQRADGSHVNVVVLDTEGIGAPTADATHDTRIFALGLLLSTFFIYNSVGSIDEQALGNMSLVTNLSKQLRSESDSDLSDYPAFLWVVRDFALQLQDQDGRSIGCTEYLEDALRDVDAAHPTASAKNRIRSCIRDFFPVRDCFTMVRPCTSETQLQTLDQLPNKSLRPEFVQQAVELRDRVFQEAALRPFRVNGVELNGAMVGSMCAQYVQAMNDGGVPVIQDAWSYVCDAQRVKKEEACMAACMTTFTTLCTTAKSSAELATLMVETCDALLLDYQELCNKLYTRATVTPLVEALDKRMTELMDAHQAQFRARFHTLVSEAVFAHMATLEAALLRNEFKDMSKFQAAVQSALATFMSTYGGGEDDQTMLDAVWYSRVEALLWRAMFDFYGGREQELVVLRGEAERMRGLLDEWRERAAAKEREVQAQHETHIQSVTEAHKFVVSQLEEQVREAVQRAECGEARQRALETESVHMTEATATEVASWQAEAEREKLRASGLETELAMLREELEDLTEDHDEMKAQTRELAQTTMERDRLRRELAQAQKELVECQQTGAQTEAKLRKDCAEVQASATQSLALLKEARRTDRVALNTSHSKCASLEATVAQLQVEVSTLKQQQLHAVEEAESVAARLRQQLEENQGRLDQVLRESCVKEQELERVAREKEQAAKSEVSQMKEERRVAEQEWVRRLKQLETRMEVAERSDAEHKRQLDLANELRKRKSKRARLDNDEEDGVPESRQRDLQLMLREKEYEVKLQEQRANSLEKQVEELKRQKQEAETSLQELKKAEIEWQVKLELASRE